MTAQVIDLDSRRRKVPEVLFCLFCRHERDDRVIPDRPHYDCPKCDETAAVPYWRVWQWT